MTMSSSVKKALDGIEIGTPIFVKTRDIRRGQGGRINGEGVGLYEGYSKVVGLLGKDGYKLSIGVFRHKIGDKYDYPSNAGGALIFFDEIAEIRVFGHGRPIYKSSS